MRGTVNGLWIGDQLGQMEKMSIRSFMQYRYEYRLWTYAPVEGVPEGVEIMDANTIIPHAEVFQYNPGTFGGRLMQGFSDLFRYKLLHQNGGWWADLDVTLLRPLPEADYSLARHCHTNYVANVMHMPQGCPIMGDAYHVVKKLIGPRNKNWFLPVQVMINLLEIADVPVEVTNFGHDFWPNLNRLIMEPCTAPDWNGVHWCASNWRFNGFDPEAPPHGGLYSKLCRYFNGSSWATAGV